jgi:hypothetical protein
MASTFRKRLPIVPLLIAGQSICGAAPTESASIGNAGRVYPHAGGLRSRRCHRASRDAADPRVRRGPKEDKKAPLRSLKDLDELAITLVDACKPIVYSSRTKRRIYCNNMSAFCHLIHRI